jgi:hypothetical protein
VIAQEGGVSASTTSEHLARLVDGGVLTVEPSGRHRYFRLAGPQVAAAVEALAVLAPQPPVSSLRESTRAAAMRGARTCYDHLAGRLGVAITDALIDREVLVRDDGVGTSTRRPTDPLAAAVPAHPYTLGPQAGPVLDRLGIDLAAVRDQPRSARPLLRFCVDWSEQRHHLAGALGAAVCERARSAGWVAPRPGGRAVQVTDAGRRAWHDTLGLQLATPGA